MVDFNDRPSRVGSLGLYDVASFGPTGGDDWSEGRGLGPGTLTIYGSDGVHDPPAVQAAGRGFNVLRVNKAVGELGFAV